MTNREKIEAAKEKFGILLEEQLARVEKMKNEAGFVDYSKLDKIIRRRRNRTGYNKGSGKGA